ncbi:hypothetical protein [Rhodopirellula sp. SWK7]|uniref:hypothetical protein n=1 Tax=Rhodopirellula sp. SWK7 TaxID=595460 RepID=UPI0002BF75A6|nr:hypothetical protein [Rhodopirellula sp. SWK7]EMI40559.1 signal peptide protein [Rhodopirellula sp. SWK7]
MNPNLLIHDAATFSLMRSEQSRGCKVTPVAMTVIALLVVFGCGSSQTPVSENAQAVASSKPGQPGTAQPDVDAKTRLREVFRRYQVSSYYEDDGEVVIHAPASRNGSSNRDSRSAETETAPLRVHLDQHELAVDAYTARIRVRVDASLSSAGSANARENVDMTAWFEEPESSHFDAQVLKQQWESDAAGRLSLERVLRDEVLRSRLSAGLAGPPPQLEWLLADRPMEKLFEPDSQFQWLESKEIERELMHRIAVTSDRERFVFWIHPATSLIRRVELPVPLTIGAGQNGWSLTLEINAATFQPPRSGQRSQTIFEAEPRFAEKFVRQFVPIPPPPPSSLLGRRFHTDDLLNAKGVQDPSRLRAAQYIVIAIPPGDDTMLQRWLSAWMQTLPLLSSPAMGQVHLVTAPSERKVIDALRQFPTPIVSVINPDEVSQLIRQLRLGDNAFALLSTPGRDGDPGRLLLTESETDISTIGNAIAVIRDSISGVDVPKKIRVDYDALIRGYETTLRANLISSR